MHFCHCVGPVFGNQDLFTGLGVFVDTYPNEEKHLEVQYVHIPVNLFYVFLWREGVATILLHVMSQIIGLYLNHFLFILLYCLAAVFVSYPVKSGSTCPDLPVL